MSGEFLPAPGQVRSRSRIRLRRVALVAGFLLLAVNLRSALTSVPPVLDQIQRDTGLPAGVVGLLTTVPVLCFAIISPAAAKLSRRVGLRAALSLFLLLVAAGALLRGFAVSTLFAGTVLVGAGIAIANVLLPAVVKQHFPRRAGLMTGLYMMFMGLGASLAAATTIPLEHLIGGGWPVATAVWALPCVIAFAVWASARQSEDRSVALDTPPVLGFRGLTRAPLAWQLTVFMGLQSLGYYSMLTWLPSLLVDAGVAPDDAGLLLGLSNLCGIPASLTIPMIAHRLRRQSPLAVLIAIVGTTALLGLMTAPATAPVLWVVLLGLSQGAAISLALVLVVLRSPSGEQAAHLSGMVQACGYALAAAGPFLVGILREHTGGWRAPIVFLLACVAVQVVAGTLAGRPRMIESPTHTTRWRGRRGGEPPG